MSMRYAKRQDYWRTVYKRQYGLAIEELSYSGLPGMKTGRVTFNGGLTAICGANGVGKSALMSALLCAMSPGTADQDRVTRLGSAELRATVRLHADSIIRTYNADTQESDPTDQTGEVIWIDCPFRVPELTSHFCRETNLEERLESEGVHSASVDELELLSYVVGKDYSLAETYELEYDDHRLLPYFRVQCGESAYGAETMGLGELSAHYILWHLRRVEGNSIVLIEEPETYLAPLSQERLVDALAQVCAERSVWVILTTHSPIVLGRVPPEHVRFLSRVGSDVEIQYPTHQAEYFQALGMPSRKSTVVLVEDRAAREFTIAWLGATDLLLTQEVDIVQAEGLSGILVALSFPKVSGWLKIIGLFDGDAVSEVSRQLKKPNSNVHWPVQFLPTTSPPEEILMSTAKGHLNELAAQIGRPYEAVHRALGTLEGKDHHDWLEELPGSLGTSYESVVRALVEIWLSTPEGLEASHAALQKLRSSIW